jgi:hypothetical protein
MSDGEHAATAPASAPTSTPPRSSGTGTNRAPPDLKTSIAPYLGRVLQDDGVSGLQHQRGDQTDRLLRPRGHDDLRARRGQTLFAQPRSYSLPEFGQPRGEITDVPYQRPFGFLGTDRQHVRWEAFRPAEASDREVDRTLELAKERLDCSPSEDGTAGPSAPRPSDRRPTLVPLPRLRSSHPSSSRTL